MSHLLDTSRTGNLVDGINPIVRPSTSVGDACINGNECFRILDLPREIRDKIYYFTLSPPPTPQGTQILWHATYGRARSFHISPALLLTNKQTSLEATEYLYTQSSAIYQINFWGWPSLVPNGVVSNEYTTQPGYSPQDLFRKDPSRAEVKTMLDERDRQLRAQSLAEGRKAIKGDPLEFGIVTRKTLLRLRHLEISLQVDFLWHRCNKWDRGNQAWSSKALMYILEKLSLRRGCSPDHTHSLTLVAGNSGHEYLPESSTGEEMLRNKRMVELLLKIRENGTCVRIQPVNSRISEGIGAVSDTIDARTFFGQGCSKQGCYYCQWT